MADPERICAVVVTYNRRNLLRRCLNDLLCQSRRPDKVVIIDNASTDGTEEMIKKRFIENFSVFYLNLGANLGGGGGFHYGAQRAFEEGFDWVWMMDDDCAASKTCLENLLKGVDDRQDVYSPIVLSSEDKRTVLWGIQATVGSGNCEVGTLPFNGFLIHRRTIETIGFPEKNFFIYGDDTEYNQRARIHGCRIIMNTDSVMYHPRKNMPKGLKIYKMFQNRLWAYYKLRNAIIIYQRYRYLSRNQIIMFGSALVFYLLTLNFSYLGLWFEAFCDGLNGRLYVRRF